MSGTGEDRWRGSRPYDQNRHHSTQRHNNPSRTMSANSGSRGGPNNTSTWGDARDQFASGPQQEQHVPVRGFNAAEAKAALRKGPGESRPYYYKPQGKDVNNRASGPWGAKPNQMASGKDFFLELRKQVTALQQGENVAGG
ncbi:hypothetical protein BO70DRAFT_358177 [Aspergillus heteromorphus CBS 117.55]|uniref:Uncharacterized protein n=1 Tax=Aspergillus heteromorphus CBS 117.55 TaxID=1448321 RepID=A0A317WWI8_9EURO|nr:uncharacterized protein BO70DRAFT_358177 [Aspergillus heteromorphus CBS 117.55]PWY90729.1 hypothetical protein BO70DRAFT_358177 [Aspergillus heteromorphus CBS 117.55]